MNIIAFKLITGEEIVANIISEDDTTYILTHPRTLMMTPGEQGQLHLSLVPWMVSAQDPTTKEEIDVVLEKSSIIGKPLSVPNQLEKGYLQNTSAIQLV